MIRATFRTRTTRELCFDLENRPLAYWYDGQTTSEITAFGWKWSDEPDVHTLILRANQTYVYDGVQAIPYLDAHLKFREILAGSDLVYGHNIRRHDLPILNAWLLRQQLEPLPELLTTDTLRDYPKRNGLSASLENLAAMYHLDGDKYAMPQPAWERANQLVPDGTDKARIRVTSDVLLQEQLRGKLLSLNLLRPPRRWSP